MASLPESPVEDEELGFDLIDNNQPVSILRPIGGLDDLCKQTKFTRQEIRVMYRGFKQVKNKCEQSSNDKYVKSRHLVIVSRSFMPPHTENG